MAEIIMKPFEIDGMESWCEVKRRTKGVLRIWQETMELEVELFSGCDPYASDLISFIMADRHVQLMIRKYYQKGRVEKYAINVTSGMSGRDDIYINFYDKYGLQIRGKHLMHVSCYNKMSGVKKMYIGDFAEAVYGYWFKPIKSTAKYTKPYMAPETASTEVHHLNLG